MKNLLAYIRSRMFLKNLAIAFGIAIALFIFLLIFLNKYSQHGKSITIPDLSDLPEEEAARYLDERNLRYEIFDSIYIADKEKGVIIDQHPKAGKEVKRNRKIYLTINANSPEKIIMPDLVGITLREARTKLTIAGLVEGRLSYRYDIAKNVVLEQRYQKEKIEAGDTIIRGAGIDLILGKGLANEKKSTPNLIGLTEEQAKIKATDAYFTIHTSIIDNSIQEEDTLVPIVYQQHPAHNPNILVPLGTQITIWLTVDSTKFPGYMDRDSSMVWDKLDQVDEIEDEIIEDANNYDFDSDL